MENFQFKLFTENYYKLIGFFEFLISKFSTATLIADEVAKLFFLYPVKRNNHKFDFFGFFVISKHRKKFLIHQSVYFLIGKYLLWLIPLPIHYFARHLFQMRTDNQKFLLSLDF